MIYTAAQNEFTVDAASIDRASSSDPNQQIIDMFSNTKSFKDVSNYRLMRGVPDFGSLVQFNPYLTGYAAFIICQMPKFIEELAKYNSEYNKLMVNWAHIVEYEFKTFDGIQDINADTQQLGDDLNNINVITRVNMQSASEFTLTYDEKSGSPLTKFAKLYLLGLNDGRTQVKTYHGLIHNKNINFEPGFEKEVFTFLFINTDVTMKKVEAAYLIIAAQLNSADTDMYNYTKGDISKREVQVKFSGYPITSPKIDKAAQDMLDYLLSSDAGARQIIVNSNNYDYTGTELIGKTLQKYGNAEQYDSVKSLSSRTSYNYNNFYVSTNDES